MGIADDGSCGWSTWLVCEMFVLALRGDLGDWILARLLSMVHVHVDKSKSRVVRMRER